MHPWLSIVIPTYNREKTLERAIKSVLSQGGDDWEIVIVDDASTDRTHEIIAQFSDPRIRTLFLEENRGVNVARNRGADDALGTWIVPLDSDDELAQGALDSIREATKSTSASWLLGRCETRRGESTVQNTERTGLISYHDYINGALQGEYLCVVKRDALMSYPFREDLRGGEHITWIQMAKAGLGPEVINAIWRIYDDEGQDRLSVKQFNYARLAQIFRTDLHVLGPEYLRVAPKRFFDTALRAAYYSLRAMVKIAQ